MNTKRNNLALIIALVAGVVTFLLVLHQIREAKRVPVRVVLAAANVGKGDSLTAADLVLSAPVKGLNSADFFLNVSDAEGLLAVEPIAKGKTVRRSAVKRPDPDLMQAEPETQQVPLAIPSGLSALTLSNDDVDRVPELLDQGQWVDLIGYVSGASDKYQTLVYSALVIAVNRDARTDRVAMTVAITPEEAELVTVALRKGKLSLVVRSEEGPKPAMVQTASFMEVIRGSSAPQRVNLTSGIAQAPASSGQRPSFSSEGPAGPTYGTYAGPAYWDPKSGDGAGTGRKTGS